MFTSGKGENLKRKASAILLISIIVIVGAIWLFLGQSENQSEDQIEEQIIDIEIVDFKWTGFLGFGPVGTLYGVGFNVTLHNLGNTDIEGITIEVKEFANDTEIWSETWFDAVDGQDPTFRLNASEIHVFDGSLMRSMALNEPEGEQVFKVICMSNSTILDELLLP